jgi:hypothetical protein
MCAPLLTRYAQGTQLDVLLGSTEIEEPGCFADYGIEDGARLVVRFHGENNMLAEHNPHCRAPIEPILVDDFWTINGDVVTEAHEKARCEATPDEFPDTHCFATSFSRGGITQRVSLTEMGYSKAFCAAAPTLEVAAWFMC